jgi:archaemetzincin
VRMKTVQLLSIGNAPAGLLRELDAPLMAQLTLATVTGKAALANPTYAFNKDRGQYHSNAIMRRLVPLVEGDVGVLALCDVDLFVPDSTFVFGEADRESKVALLSVARLRQGADPEQLKRRVQVEGLHLAGHLVGLSYCEDARCVMFLATSPQDVDRKQAALCHVCRNELTKLLR